MWYPNLGKMLGLLLELMCNWAGGYLVSHASLSKFLISLIPRPTCFSSILMLRLVVFSTLGTKYLLVLLVRISEVLALSWASHPYSALVWVLNCMESLWLKLYQCTPFSWLYCLANISPQNGFTMANLLGETRLTALGQSHTWNIYLACRTFFLFQCKQKAPLAVLKSRGLEPLSNYIPCTPEKCLDRFSSGGAQRLRAV